MRPIQRALPLLAAAIIVASLILAGCGGSAPTCGPDDGSCLKVLFLGNSYTYVNDLPGTFAGLAWSGGHGVKADSMATGGETLAGHLADAGTVARLDLHKWDFVVLQEQSEIPAFEASRQTTMNPSARALVSMIRERNEMPMFFMTWAHSGGLPDSGLPDYPSMQRQIDAGYMGIAQELHAMVAPVGDTWSIVRRQSPDIELWAPDGSHPSTAGTYLAACVFYAAIFRESPSGLAFADGLAGETAAALQNAAASNVLSNLRHWGLG